MEIIILFFFFLYLLVATHHAIHHRRMIVEEVANESTYWQMRPIKAMMTLTPATVFMLSRGKAFRVTNTIMSLLSRRSRRLPGSGSRAPNSSSRTVTARQLTERDVGFRGKQKLPISSRNGSNGPLSERRSAAAVAAFTSKRLRQINLIQRAGKALPEAPENVHKVRLDFETQLSWTSTFPAVIVENRGH